MSICSFIALESERPKMYRFYEFMNSSMGKLTLDNLMKARGWETWKKYAQLFPSSNFILLENLEFERTTIILINRKSFLNVVEQNINDFRAILGAELTPQILLEKCIASQSIFNDALKRHDGLLGILLGYGRHNAFLFSRRQEISGNRERQKFSLTNKPLLPAEGFATLAEEYQHIDNQLILFNEFGITDFNPHLMPLPMFVADRNHPETKELKTKYLQQYKKIIKAYSCGNSLEITLNKFCEN